MLGKKSDVNFTQNKINEEIKRLEKTIVTPSPEVLELLKEKNSSPIKSGIKMSELLKRPEISYYNRRTGAFIIALFSGKKFFPERKGYNISKLVQNG